MLSKVPQAHNLVRKMSCKKSHSSFMGTLAHEFVWLMSKCDFLGLLMSHKIFRVALISTS